MASVIFQDECHIPLGLATFEEFQRWTWSSQFPERGRIDYVDGNVEVDMSPEDLFTHGTVKGKIYATLLARIEELDLGHLFVDRTRVSLSHANSSVEPDIVFVSHQAIQEDRIRLVPAASDAPDRFIEWQGAPDLVVEVVSDSSVEKDTKRLFHSYGLAGVSEYWLVDARGSEVDFQIHRLVADRYQQVESDDMGFRFSPVMNAKYRLDRQRGTGGFWQYRLHCQF